MSGDCGARPAGHPAPMACRLRQSSREFVVIAAGGHVFPETQGDAIVAFALE